MRDKLLEDMAVYKGQFRLYNDTDTMFMNDHEFTESKYAFVHFDGPLMTRDVLTECIWFANRTAPTTRFVFDDFPKYNMQLIRDCLQTFGFDILDQGKNKICLEKERRVM